MLQQKIEQAKKMSSVTANHINWCIKEIAIKMTDDEIVEFANDVVSRNGSEQIVNLSKKLDKNDARKLAIIEIIDWMQLEVKNG